MTKKGLKHDARCLLRPNLENASLTSEFVPGLCCRAGRLTVRGDDRGLGAPTIGGSLLGLLTLVPSAMKKIGLSAAQHAPRDLS